MRIGDLARRVGASEHQLRAWERRYGLLKPRRSSGNYRLYSNADEARVRTMQRYLERGIPTAQAAELAVAVQLGVSSGAGDTLGDDEATRARRAMRDALDKFDETAAQRALEGLFAAFSATTVVREVLLPY